MPIKLAEDLGREPMTSQPQVDYWKEYEKAQANKFAHTPVFIPRPWKVRFAVRNQAPIVIQDVRIRSRRGSGS